MKLLSLNAEGGSQGRKLLDYLAAKSKTTDIFCFQEMFRAKKSKTIGDGSKTDIYQQLQRLLKNYNSEFYTVSETAGEYYQTGFKTDLGLAVFVKKDLNISAHRGKHVVGLPTWQVDFRNGKEANAVQCVKVSGKGREFWVANFHGASRPGSKLDSPLRLAQSRRLVAELKACAGEKILCGDFNLLPDTESIKLIERAGLANLIKKFRIKNTRNSISWERYKNRQSFADFTFVSKGVKVKDFKVPYNLVSDHLPMVLEFNV